jgi:hypothetical protein
MISGFGTWQSNKLCLSLFRLGLEITSELRNARRQQFMFAWTYEPRNPDINKSLLLCHVQNATVLEMGLDLTSIKRFGTSVLIFLLPKVLTQVENMQLEENSTSLFHFPTYSTTPPVSSYCLSFFISKLEHWEIKERSRKFHYLYNLLSLFSDRVLWLWWLKKLTFLLWILQC